MAKIVIPTALRQFTDQNDSIEVTGGTVAEALSQLTAQYPNIKKNLYNEQGKLRSFVNVYVNDEDIRYLAKENTPTKDGDTISIIPSIAGGCNVCGVARNLSHSTGRSVCGNCQ
jgi:molybdopterin converting factor small subunit